MSSGDVPHPCQHPGYLSSVLSAREIAGFRRALLQAWLFLQDRGQLGASPLIPPSQPLGMPHRDR